MLETEAQIVYIHLFFSSSSPSALFKITNLEINNNNNNKSWNELMDTLALC